MLKESGYPLMGIEMRAGTLRRMDALAELNPELAGASPPNQALCPPGCAPGVGVVAAPDVGGFAILALRNPPAVRRRRLGGETTSAPGLYFGGRNHSTAVAAEKKVRKWIEEDGSLNLGGQQYRVRELVERVVRELLR